VKSTYCLHPCAFLPAPVFASTQVAQAQVRKQEQGPVKI